MAGTFHTSGQDRYPWFALDLGQAHLVTGLTIHPRVDCCNSRTDNIDVRVGNVRPPVVSIEHLKGFNFESV